LGLDEKEKRKKKRAGKEKVDSMKEKRSKEKEVTCDEEDSAETMEAQIEEKEILIQQRRDFLEQIVEVHGKEMAKVITDIEAAEDEKNEKLKEKSAVEMQISDLKIKHKRLEREVKEKDKTMINLARKKRDLETYIENNVVSTKKEIALLEEDIKSLKTYRPPQPSTEARNDGSIARGQLNLQLIEFIESKIEAKEEELACPVCLEVASPPIFTCSDLHLICSDCKPKVSICPECREPYPEKAKRHRYAEKAAEELAGLMEERARALDTQT